MRFRALRSYTGKSTRELCSEWLVGNCDLRDLDRSGFTTPNVGWQTQNQDYFKEYLEKLRRLDV